MYSRFCSQPVSAALRNSSFRTFSKVPHGVNVAAGTKLSASRTSGMNATSKSWIETKSHRHTATQASQSPEQFANFMASNPKGNNYHRFDLLDENKASDGTGFCTPHCVQKSHVSIYTEPGISADKDNTSEDNSQTVWKHDVIPQYLDHTYWWAYIHPNAVKFFERPWLVNLILWGNYYDLQNAAVAAIDDTTSDDLIATANAENRSANFLQIAAAYGSFTVTLLQNKLLPLSSKLNVSPTLNLIDVAPVQLLNTHQKILAMDPPTDESQHCNVVLSQQNSSSLSYDTNSMDIVFLYFLLHEMPTDVRTKTINDALRVVKPDSGKLVVVDYHLPESKWNPMRYVMWPVLHFLEPFAMDLWRAPITDWIDFENFETNDTIIKLVEKKLYFGGLYQKNIFTKVSKS